MKKYITENEFDSLNFIEQRDYRYCPTCGQFYHVDYNSGICSHGNKSHSIDYYERYGEYRNGL